MSSDGFFVSPTMCRACLRRDAEKEIFSTHTPTSLTFSSILKICIRELQIDYEDEFPKNICLKCLKLLISFYKFRTMVLENDSKIRRMLEERQQMKNNSLLMSQNQFLTNDIGICYIQDINTIVQPVPINPESHGAEITPNDIIIVTDTESCIDSDEINSDFEEQDNDKRNKASKCEICGKILSCKGNLNQHIKTHTGERNYSCDICEKKFFKAEHVLIHKRTHTGERPHKCLICSKSFIQYGALKSHLKIHSGERNHVCSMCGKSFVRSSSLISHMRTHSEETPYVCQLCNKGFKSSGNLNIHMRFHQNERNYICHICDKRFVTSSHLNVHMKQHNGEKPHKCVVCGKGFVRSEHLKIHLIIHSGQKPFYCRACPRRFTQNSHLKRHMRTHHQEVSNS